MNETIVTVIAQEKLTEVETLSSKLAQAEIQLEAGYAKLAFLLKDVSENRYWQGTYNSFGTFLEALQIKYHLGKSQMYNYLSTAKELAGQLDESQLNEMGISKAMVLRKAHKASGVEIPQHIVNAALDSTVTVGDLEKILYDENVMGEPEEGTWLSLNLSCYVTAEEEATIRDAFNAARHSDPPVDETAKESFQRKQILLKICQEFLAAYSSDVVEGGKNI